MIRVVETRRILAVVAGLFCLCMTTTTTAVAQQAPGQQQEEVIELPEVGEPAIRTDQGAEDLAIVVAVQNYHNLAPVSGAEVTALDWEAFFTGHLGMDDDRVLLMANEEAMPSLIETRVEQHLEKAGENSRVWFVFIGHGAPDPTEKDPEGLLVGVGALNTTAETFRQHSLPRQDVEEMLAAGDQRQTVMVLDTCFSGVNEHGQTLTGTQAVVPVQERLEPDLGEQDIVFRAADHDEAAHSLPGPTVDRPAFSYALLGAFRGWADTTGDGAVTPREAEDYVRRALVGMQTPAVTVEDQEVRRAAIVEEAPEQDPGFSAQLQSLINRGQAHDEPCETDGKVRNVDTQGNCCWPGQAYSSQQNSCVGTPMCPDGMVLGDDGDCREAREDEEAFDRGVDDECETPARCVQMGQDAYYGRDGDRDYERAAELFEAGCDGGDAEGCNWLGYLYRQGRGVEQDMVRAVQFYEKACEGENMFGCNNLGNLYRLGILGVEQDLEKAIQLFETACHGGSAKGCRILGRQHLGGQGIEPDDSRAFQLFRKACRGGDMPGCNDAGYLIEHGIGVDEKDRTVAATLYEEACEKGEPLACERLEKLEQSHRGFIEPDREASTTSMSNQVRGMLFIVGEAEELDYHAEALDRLADERRDQRLDELKGTLQWSEWDDGQRTQWKGLNEERVLNRYRNRASELRYDSRAKYAKLESEIEEMDTGHPLHDFFRGVWKHEVQGVTAQRGVGPKAQEPDDPDDPISQIDFAIDRMENAVDHYEEAKGYYRQFLDGNHDGYPAQIESARQRLEELEELTDEIQSEIPDVQRERDKLERELEMMKQRDN